MNEETTSKKSQVEKEQKLYLLLWKVYNNDVTNDVTDIEESFLTVRKNCRGSALLHRSPASENRRTFAILRLTH